MRDIRIRMVLGVVKDFVEQILLVTSSTDSFVEGMFPQEHNIVIYNSEAVTIILTVTKAERKKRARRRRHRGKGSSSWRGTQTLTTFRTGEADDKKVQFRAGCTSHHRSRKVNSGWYTTRLGLHACIKNRKWQCRYVRKRPFSSLLMNTRKMPLTVLKKLLQLRIPVLSRSSTVSFMSVHPVHLTRQYMN